MTGLSVTSRVGLSGHGCESCFGADSWIVESEWYCTSARPARRGTVEIHVGQLDLIRVDCPYAHALLHWIHGRADKSG